ncbi:MAG TPA: hypothetical protein VHA57_00115, partial [Actinomycetota bacterium]|nr:hypothetical protein [Actinomycetota bacterium]
LFSGGMRLESGQLPARRPIGSGVNAQDERAGGRGEANGFVSYSCPMRDTQQAVAFGRAAAVLFSGGMRLESGQLPARRPIGSGVNAQDERPGGRGVPC